MKRPFIHDNFLLENKNAQELYHTFASPMPIIDYHCHLSPCDIANDRRFPNLTHIWLLGDHYKWRAMRACGVEEKYITGDASDWEKFEKWAETVPRVLRNPLYHWTHLELKRPFGIADLLLDKSTARKIWDRCNALLEKPDFSVRGILRQMNVEFVCTTDDPVDTLEFHIKMAGEGSGALTMLPAFRPDRAMAIEDGGSFLNYLSRLEASAGITVRKYDDFVEAIRKRHDFFHQHGCRLSDHGLERIYAVPYTSTDINTIFIRLLNRQELDSDDVDKFKSAMLFEFGVMDWEKGWVQQFHLEALRNTNSRMLRTLGPDTGYDSIGDWDVAKPLARFLNRLDDEDKLAKTILYNLNPAHNEVFASMIGNFQGGQIPGKLQYGAAWWFLDQQDGMRRQLEALSTMGLLGQFVGMLTDSRSFLSYPRHEYFRRLLCNILGSEIERGLVPDDMDLVGGMVKDICYFNAKRYFGFQRRPQEFRG